MREDKDIILKSGHTYKKIEYKSPDAEIINNSKIPDILEKYNFEE